MFVELTPTHIDPKEWIPTHVYIVGTVASIHTRNGKTTYSLPRYYKDTRNDPIYATEMYSNHFTSLTDPSNATKFETYEEALAWKEKNLGDGEYVIFRYH